MCPFWYFATEKLVDSVPIYRSPIYEFIQATNKSKNIMSREIKAVFDRYIRKFIDRQLRVAQTSRIYIFKSVVHT